MKHALAIYLSKINKPLIYLVILSVFYAWIFLPLLPTSKGLMASDWSLGLTSILAGDYWFNNNGLLSIPYFSPFKCGGYPYYPTNSYYTIVQFLSFVIDPLWSIRIAFLLFAGVGCYGMYFLLRKSYLLRQEAAVLGSALFMFNGFYAYRCIMGHYFQVEMFAPLLAWLLLERVDKVSRLIGRSLICSALLAYMVYASALQILPAILLSILILMLIHSICYGWRVVPYLLYGVSGLFAIGLSASKLVAMTSLLEQFPRNDYLLPGVERFGDLLMLVFQSVFFSPPSDAHQHLSNAQWFMERHEWEYGVSPIPFIILIAWLVFVPFKKVAKIFRDISPARRWGIPLVIVLAFMPILINWYSPTMNAFLKSLPYFGTSSNLIRWFIVFIPLTILLGVFLYNQLLNNFNFKSKNRWRLTFVALTFLVAWNVSSDKGFYKAQATYDVAPVLEAWKENKATGAIPPIKEIILQNTLIGKGPNDAMVKGASAIACYEPTMGYRLEKFPVAPLRVGPVFQDGSDINIKNPACYSYPAANNCKPGDHFLPSQRKDAELFVAYKPFNYQLSSQQLLANHITKASIAIALCIVLFLSLTAFFNRIVILKS